MTLWSGASRVAVLSEDGRPTMSLLDAAGLRFRGPWASGERYAQGDVVTLAGRGYRRDASDLADEPGQGVGWVQINEPDLFALIADRWVAANGGVRPTVRALELATVPSSGVGPAGSVPA